MASDGNLDLFEANSVAFRLCAAGLYVLDQVGAVSLGKDHFIGGEMAAGFRLTAAISDTAEAKLGRKDWEFIKDLAQHTHAKSTETLASRCRPDDFVHQQWCGMHLVAYALQTLGDIGIDGEPQGFSLWKNTVHLRAEIQQTILATIQKDPNLSVHAERSFQLNYVDPLYPYLMFGPASLKPLASECTFPPLKGLLMPILLARAARAMNGRQDDEPTEG